MSELISGKEALIAWYDGEDVFKSVNHTFRLKPRTITLNGIEVPAPFEPKDGDFIFTLSGSHTFGYKGFRYIDSFTPMIGAWRTEDEIKKVVVALRSVFKGY